MKKVLSLLLAVFILAASFVGCGGAKGVEEGTVKESENTQEQSQEKQQETSTEGAMDRNASFELRFISSMTDENRTKLLEETAKKFNEKWPNVTIVNDSSTEYGQKMKLSFSSGDGHEMVYVDDLNQQTLHRNNYLMDITEDVISRGWIEKQVKGAVEFNNLRTPGKYYSVPFLMAPVIMYYNKDIFEKLTVQPPKNTDEFLVVLEKAKQAGYVPFENSGDNNYPLLWLMFNIILNKAPKEDIDKWYYNKETPETVKQAFIEAFRIGQNMAQKGYFRKNFEGVSYDSVPQLYGQGKTAMITDGDWNLAAYEGTQVPTGIFAFPGAESGKSPIIVNATDGAWALNAKLPADKKAAALDYIDAFMDPGIIKMWYEGGLTPSVKFDISSANATPLKAELNAAVAETRLGFFLDNAVPGFLDVITKQSQLLVLNKITPEQCWDAINAEYEKQKSKTNGN